MVKKHFKLKEQDFLALSLTVILSLLIAWNLKVDYVEADNLQEACQTKWNQCKVLNKDTKAGLFMFSYGDQSNMVHLSSFRKGQDSYLLHPDKHKRMSIGTWQEGITNSNFNDAYTLDRRLSGKVIYGYISNRNVDRIQITYSIKTDNHYKIKEVVIPVTNQTFFYYTNNNQTHIYEKIKPMQ